MPREPDQLSDQSVAVATGDFNHPEFLSRPSRAVEVGERVLCHDCDRTVDDYWGVVRAVHPPRTLHSPDAEKTYPYGLIHVEVKRKVPMPRELLEAAAQAHLRSCRQRGSSWTRLLDEDYEAIIDAYRDHELCGSLFTCESCRAASDEGWTWPGDDIMDVRAHWYASEGDGVPWVVMQDEGGMHNAIAECGERGIAERIARALNDSRGAVEALRELYEAGLDLADLVGTDEAYRRWELAMDAAQPVVRGQYEAPPAPPRKEQT